MSRYQTINSIAEILLPNGNVVHKLDFLGTVSVYGSHYFNVWRRYNNLHEIVLEDFSGDFHFSKNYTVRQTIQNILCLSTDQMKGVYTIRGISYKHRADISEEVTSMRWTDIQRRWYALDMNLGGILQDFHCIPPLEVDDEFMQEQSPQIKQEQQGQQIKQEEQRKDHKNLSDRFAELESWTSLSSSENFMVLRNGTKVKKPRS